MNTAQNRSPLSTSNLTCERTTRKYISREYVSRGVRIGPLMATGIAAGVLGFSCWNGTAQAKPVNRKVQVIRANTTEPEVKVRWDYQQESPIPVPEADPISTPAARPAAKPVPLGPVRSRVAKGRVAQAETNEPAAAPDDDFEQSGGQEEGLQVPVNPNDEARPPRPAAPTAADNARPPAVAPGASSTNPNTTPLLPPTSTAPSVDPSVQPSAMEGREIATVRVVGNRVIDEQTILLQVKSTRTGFAFSPLQAERDRARIEELGFFAQVQYQVTPSLEDTDKVDVVFTVVENRVVNGFVFSGNTVVPEADLIAILETKTGSIARRDQINRDIEKIQGLFRRRGYFVLVTDVDQNEAGQIIFTLEFAKISQIRIEGLDKTDESLVRRQIRTKPGDTYNELQLLQDLNRIRDTNFFEEAIFRPDDDPNLTGAEELIVTFVVKERRTGTLSLGVGFDSRSRVSGFATISENNFRGMGKQIGASVEVGGQRSFNLSFGDPFVGQKNAAYTINVYNRRFFREPSAIRTIIGQPDDPEDFNVNYEERREGGRLNYNQPLDFDRTRTALFGYRNERARLFQTDLLDEDGDGVGDARPIDLPADSSGRISAFSLGFLRDKRDLRIDPSRGSREQFLVEKAFSFLGGESDFTKFDVDLRRYIPLSSPEKLGDQPKLVLAGRVVLGQSLGQLPPFEQYFVGGPDTVRGYNVDEQYGDNQIFGNLELRYRFQPRFQFVGFVDAGTAYGGNFSSNEDSNVLFSVGVGLRLQTPIGPVRLDVGRGDQGVKTHFAIGSTF